MSTTATATATERLRALGYDFDAQGIMRQLDSATGKLSERKFYFHKSTDYPTNQKHYEQLGGVIDDYVYELLDKHGMKRIQVPKDQPADMASFVFATKAELKDVDKLMILVHGSGVVRAGQCKNNGTPKWRPGIEFILFRGEKHHYQRLVGRWNSFAVH